MLLLLLNSFFFVTQMPVVSVGGCVAWSRTLVVCECHIVWQGGVFSLILLPLFFFYSWRLHINFVYSVRARVLMAEPLFGIGESVCQCVSVCECVCACLTVAR